MVLLFVIGPKGVIRVPRRLHWKASSHIQMWKSEAFKYDRWIWLGSLPWMCALIWSKYSQVFQIHLWDKDIALVLIPQKTEVPAKKNLLHLCQEMLKITAVKSSGEGKLVYGTKGITACPSEVWLWISQIGHWRLYHCTNCVQGCVKPHSFCLCRL